MREIDDVQDAIDQGQSQCDQRIDGSHHHATQDGRYNQNRHQDLLFTPQRAVPTADACGDGVCLVFLHRHREDSLGTGILLRENKLDLVTPNLRIHRLGTGIVTIDKFGRAIRHNRFVKG